MPITTPPPAAPEIEELEEYDESDATRNGGLSFVGPIQTNIPTKTVTTAEQLNLENFVNISKAHENLPSNNGKKKKKKKKRAQAEV